MSERRRRYKKRADRPVVAVRLDLDTDGFEYRKWGGVQRCKRGDWIVDNDGDVYTVDAQSFQETYTRVSPGVYVKHTLLWAAQATEDGVVRTKEGSTRYSRGDYLVSNHEDGTDAWEVDRATFEAMYEPAD